MISLEEYKENFVKKCPVKLVFLENVSFEVCVAQRQLWIQKKLVTVV